MKPIHEQFKQALKGIKHPEAGKIFDLTINGQALTEALTTGTDVDACVVVCWGEGFEEGYVGGDAWGGRPDELLETPRKFYTMKQGQRMIATYEGWQKKASEAQNNQDMANARSHVNDGETIEQRQKQIAGLNWTLWGLKLGRDLTK